MNIQAPKSKHKGILLIASAMAVAVAVTMVGCASDPHQIVTDTSGDGIYGKAAVPIGQFGSVGVWGFIGRFKQTDIIQPTSTNKVYAPNVSVVAEGRGAQTVSAASGSGTNATTGINGGSWDVSSLFTGSYIGSSTGGTNGVVTIDQK